MDDHMVPIHVQQVGDCQFARFVLRDEIGQFFTGSGWSDEPSGAALYYRPPDALEAHDRFYVEGQQARETFTATVIVTVCQGEWTAKDLKEHLRQYGKFILRPSGEQRGVVVEMDWDDLMQKGL
jgi:hypothetical protein